MFYFAVLRHLNGVYLFERPMQIRMSKHTQVQLPKEGQDEENLTQVFYRYRANWHNRLGVHTSQVWDLAFVVIGANRKPT